MSRHIWRARAHEGGFTFVELLVTILIAGIAFAALVPVFVGAQQVASGEQQRNAALGLAQDKLEKVRSLDYDLITQTGLTNDTIPNAQFGTSVSWATGGGGTRTYNVAYQVDLLPEGSAPGTESYKQVTITVAWTGNPQPVKPVVLSTMVSKQYAGPQIVRFNIGPDNVLDEINGSTVIVSGPITIDAYIAAEDILSMNQGAIEENRGYVEFTVNAVNGTSVATQKVTVPVSGEPNHYTFAWDNTEATDGVYIFQAVAVAGFGSRAQGMPVSIALQYTNHAPPPPTNLAISSVGDTLVQLGWTAPATGDVNHYQVWRSTDNVTFARIADNVTSTTYQDTAVVNGTTYYYKVRTVDSEGLVGAPTEAVSATPNVTGDSVPPTDPTPLTATVAPGQPTVHLAWTASVDGGTPTTGLAGYTIERAASSAGPWTTLQGAYMDVWYDDTAAGWAQTWYYRVKAMDFAGNSSAYVTAGPVTTPAVVYRSLTVTNSSGSDVYVWIQNAGLLTWYDIAGNESTSRPSSGERVRKNNKSVTWANLPGGIYNVYVLSSSTWSGAAILRTQAVNLTAGDGSWTY